jgi:phasin family protein
MTPNYTDFAKVSEEAVATIIKTNTALVKGFEQLTKYFNDLVSASVEEAIAAGKKVAEVKSVTDFVEVQAKLAQASFETLTTESKKVTDLTLSIAKDVSEPLTERFKAGFVAATKAAKPMKAAA